MEKRFALFAFDTYYPAGGFNDFIGLFESYADAVFMAGIANRGNFHVVDMIRAEVVTPQTLAKACASEIIRAVANHWDDRDSDEAFNEDVAATIRKHYG